MTVRSNWVVAHPARASAARRRVMRIAAPFMRSGRHHVHEFVDRRGLELPLAHAQLEDGGALLLGEAAREVGLELLHEDGHALLAAALVADGIFDDDLPHLLPVLE